MSNSDADAATLRDAKAALIALVGVLTLCASRTPWCLTSVFRRSSLDVMNGLSALSAGIVFGAFMTHMLPSAGEDFSAYLEIAYPVADGGERAPFAEKMVSYPWATLIAGTVTALLVAVDRTIVAHGVHGDDGEHDHHHRECARARTALPSPPLRLSLTPPPHPQTTTCPKRLWR
jgi:hypothetical protein